MMSRNVYWDGFCRRPWKRGSRHLQMRGRGL